MIDYRKLDDLMEELSFPEGFAGTALIRSAVAQIDAERSISMTKELYPALAKAAGITAERAERNIRSAISNAVECCSWPETRMAWQGFMRGQAPTNREVLCRLARRCRVED